MKKYLYITISFFLAIVLLISGGLLALKGLLPLYLSRQFNADVKIEQISLGFKEGIKAKGVSINSVRGLYCSIEEAVFDYDIVRIIKSGLNFNFSLKDVVFSYSESKLINGIVQALSIKSIDIFHFNSVKGEFYQRNEEIAVKSLEADGDLIKLFADGTIIKEARIDCSFKILLARELVTAIPDSVREVFFKQEGEWSEVELYITGDLDKPSINFSTDLFKLIVR